MASPSLCIQKESVSNCFPTPTFVLGKWRQLSDRLVSNFIVRQMSFLCGTASITGLRHQCSSTVKPAVSPFNTLTLMSVAHCQVQKWHPLSLHYVKRVTCGIQASVLEGKGGGLIARDTVDLHERRTYFITAISRSIGQDIFCQIWCVVSWSCRSVVLAVTVHHLTVKWCSSIL